MAQTNPIQLSPDQEAKQRQADQIINTPFDFFGMVIDENGASVPGATVHIMVMGEVGQVEGQTEHDVTSDENGRFSLKGIRAFGVIVTAEKKGYLAISSPPGHWSHDIRGSDFPTAEHPAVLRLQKE